MTPFPRPRCASAARAEVAARAGQVVTTVLHQSPRGVTWGTPRDVCVSAPTGSGKTLAYALPLVQALLGRVVCRLRGLVVVPTRDLAAQVQAVLLALAAGTGLQVAAAAGLDTFAAERARMAPRAVGGAGGAGAEVVDILVATPGRLMEHVRHAAGFSLAELRFLVVDEADRLLSQPYQALPHPARAPGPPRAQRSRACGRAGCRRCWTRRRGGCASCSSPPRSRATRRGERRAPPPPLSFPVLTGQVSSLPSY
jgi:hypothetical protein